MEYIQFLPSTTVHFPQDLLDHLDQIARRRGISRNRYVVESCRAATAQDDGEWPAGFFDLDPGDSVAELQEAVDEMEGAIRATSPSPRSPSRTARN